MDKWFETFLVPEESHHWAKDPNDLRTSKTFVGLIALGIQGKECGSDSCLSTILKNCKHFTAGWKWTSAVTSSPA